MILDKYQDIEHLKLELPEGLIWDAECNRFLFVDILRKKLYSLVVDPNVVVEQLNVFDGEIGCVFPDKPSSGYLCAVTPSIIFWPTIINPLKSFNFSWPYTEEYRFNDGLLDGDLLWIGIMSKEQPDKDSNGGLFGLTREGRVYFHDQVYEIPNGPVISKDKNWLIHADSGKGLVYGYKYRGLGTAPESKTILIDCRTSGGTPDGMTIDSLGNLYVAMWGAGQIWKFDVNFQHVGTINIENKYVTNVCFGGNSLDRIFVTYAKNQDICKFGGICEVISANTSMGLGISL